MEGENRQLIIYIAIARGLNIINSYSSTHEDITGVAKEALKVVPEHSSHYTMSFDDVMIAFWRDKAQTNLTFFLGCHTALTKERAWDALARLRDAYVIMAKRSTDNQKLAMKLEQKMIAILEEAQGKIPPKEDLVVYADAPGAYLVRHPVDEEPPEGYLALQQQQQQRKAAGRKTLQEELAELGDEDSESESDASLAKASAGGLMLGGKLAEQKLRMRSGPVGTTGPVVFPFQRAQAAAKKQAWSMEIRPKTAVAQPPPPPLLPVPAPVPPAHAIKATRPDATWSMEYTEWSAKAAKAHNLVHNLETVSERSSSGESKASRASGMTSNKGSTLDWARKNGGISADVMQLVEKKTVGVNRPVDPEGPSSTDSSPSNTTDKVPLRAASLSRSEDYSDTSSPRQGKKKHSPLRDFAVNIIGWTDQPRMQRNNSKSQEYPARVSPEERLQRETRTEILLSPKLCWQSERSKPTPGKIGVMAPSGLTWEEEIRRMRVAHGLAPPRLHSGGEGADAGVAVRDAPPKGAKAPQPTHGHLEGQPAANQVEAKTESRHRGDTWRRPPGQRSNKNKPGCFCF